MWLHGWMGKEKAAIQSGVGPACTDTSSSARIATNHTIFSARIVSHHTSSLPACNDTTFATTIVTTHTNHTSTVTLHFNSSAFSSSRQITYPLQPVEVPAPELSASVSSHDLHFTPSFLASIRAWSCSRQNFSVNLVRSLFSLDERKVSNVASVLGKKSLTLKGLHVLRRQRFRHTH